MSEKRFELRKYDDSWEVYDNETFECYTIHNVSDLLNEQQATIRKLQDLCGKSDGENAKLRIENKEQQATIKVYEEGLTMKIKKINEQQSTITRLEEENEQLRKELGDCEKFRYQVFKRMNDEYIKERSIK